MQFALTDNTAHRHIGFGSQGARVGPSYRLDIRGKGRVPLLPVHRSDNNWNAQLVQTYIAA